MADEGVSYSAVGLFSTEGSGFAQCAFTVAAVKTDQLTASLDRVLG
ncbi:MULTISPECIES: hypothetical protein [unclassified Streptomyces]|nr:MULTISPECIES: hypothetical protein [unclassified Streptomyces]MCX4989241.1 hypothetical protein [Streptomyces sp. NBC_00568]MCX5005538.1 hypothetical protein [Streptomyces sp. NBC_00638]